MTFDDRRRMAFKAVQSFLAQYTPPRGLDDSALERVVDGIADALARKMPLCGESEYPEALARVLAAVADAHASWAWPPQGAFVAAIPKVSARVSARAPETFAAPDQASAHVRAMDRGDPVPETFIWSGEADNLVASGSLDAERLREYRRGSAASRRRLYGPMGEDILIARYGDTARRFFDNTQR